MTIIKYENDEYISEYVYCNFDNMNVHVKNKYKKGDDIVEMCVKNNMQYLCELLIKENKIMLRKIIYDVIIY